MSKYFIVAQSDATAASLVDRLKAVPGTDDEPIILLWSAPSLDAAETLEVFGSFAATVEDLLFLSGADDVVALVDRVEPNLLSAVDIGGWNCILAMLILSFPEIRWTFNLVIEAPNGWEEIAAATQLSRDALRGRDSALFDAAGLRDWVRRITNRALEEDGDPLRLPLRLERAAVIEDESAFAYLHGCTAYRYGYRVELVTSWRRMATLFSGSGSHGFTVLIEDLNLHFADREAGVHLSDLEARAHACARLDSKDRSTETSRCRILVTTGASSYGPKSRTPARDYLRAKSIGVGKVVSKPTKGMAHLWEQVGQLRRVSARFPNVGAWWWPELAAVWRRGNSPTFIFPPAGLVQYAQELDGHSKPSMLSNALEHLLGMARSYSSSGTSVSQRWSARLADLGAKLWTLLAPADQSEGVRGSPPTESVDVALSGHGAPGKLGVVVERLLARARRYASAGDGVPLLIAGAVVARDALEISGARAPALSLEALSLQHKLELKAECQFSGLEFHIDLYHRRWEIRDMVAAASLWFDPQTRARAALNAEMKTMLGLIPILREHGQFEEEQQWMGVVRQLQARIWARHRWRQPLLWVLLYANFILSSLFAFFSAISFWLILLAMFFMGTSVKPQSFSCSLGDAVTSMFSVGGPYSCIKDTHPPQALVSFAIVIGFLHLGIFISHLYNILSRR